MIRFSAEYIRSSWASGERIKIRNKSYRIGRMSYGEYFAELWKQRNRSETLPHHSETLWFVGNDERGYTLN